MVTASLVHRMRFRGPINLARLAVLLLITNGFCYADNKNTLSGHPNPFTEALERTTTASEKTFKDSGISDNTSYLSIFTLQRSSNTIDQKKPQPQLSHKQTSTINAVLATGEFVSSGTDLLIYPYGGSKNSDYKTGTAAMNHLLKLSLKNWFKENNFDNDFLNSLSKTTPIELNNPTFKTNQDKNWDYSVKLSGEKIKLQFGKEL